MSFRDGVEAIEHEGLKDVAADTLSLLGNTHAGRLALARYAGNSEKAQSDRLAVDCIGIEFENPIIVGAGWDKTGKAAAGLHALGFAGVEVGTVTAFPQPGNPKPRLWTIDRDHSVGLNRMGFNSPGAEAVAKNLERHGTPDFPLGINIGRNKIVPNEMAPELHALTASILLPYADWITLGVSSPNTEGLRNQQRQDLLARIITATQTVMDEGGYHRPLLIKIAPDLSTGELNDIVDVALDLGCQGIVAVNTTIDAELKRRYGERWAEEAGGLSGADPTYEQRANDVIRAIYERAGHRLTVMGAGGAHDAESVIRKLEAGAQLIQIVTAIRQHRGRVLGAIVPGLLRHLDERGVGNAQDLVGSGTERGTLQK